MVARSEDRRTFSIQQFTEMIETTTLANSDRTYIRGPSRLKTSNRWAGNSKGNALYEIVQLGLLMRKVG